MNCLIDNRQWVKLSESPSARVIIVAYEFYANLVDHQDNKVMVQGKMVSFMSMAINAYYGIPDILEPDEYVTYARGIMDYDAVIDALYYLGSIWKNGELVSFRASQLLNPTQAWYYFMLANVLPSRYASDVTKERAILLYTIIQGMTINIGRIIHSSMLQAANRGHLGIWFPLLIIELCHGASVIWVDTDPLVLPKGIIDDKFMRKFQT
ncbi:putative S-locus lectin protein kinase family protein [Quillaja saponaria]|uniref:S-locus lectin protein kinase family protein n=1 Tax=Quillaja saponaria TaxID=32244 RepID=A0AAD7LK85_QUISA|nr:putative S-locus lectin protein kinase family protein [Quillaja saponaria]